MTGIYQPAAESQGRNMNQGSQTLIHIGPTLAIAVAVLMLIAVLVNRRNGPGMSAITALAAGRALLQLGLLAVILSVIIRTLWASIAFVVVMAVVAAVTSAGRVSGRRPTIGSAIWCFIPVGACTMLIVATLVIAGTIPATGLAIIPVAGILFGGAMNTTSLAGKRAHDELRTRHGEVEAALSLGMVARDARMEVCGASAATALIPGIDQTRSVGLVTIPGAFVGMILGGASTTSAAIMQLFVLVSLLLVSGVAALVTVELVARGTL